MSYRKVYEIENEQAKERYELVLERVRQAANQPETQERFADYFERTARFILLTANVLELEQKGMLEHRSMEECERLNRRLYEDILPCVQDGGAEETGGFGYETSYANPAYAVERLGEEFGGALCFLYAECRALIAYAFEGRLADMTTLLELFVEIYTCFCDGSGTGGEEIRRILYWHFHDYSEIIVTQSVREGIDPQLDFFTSIVRSADLTDFTYLYRYGEYISENERRTAQYLSELPPERIQAMADTFTEGYRIGFEVTNKDLSKKKTVSIHYAIGFERVVRAAIHNFEKMGLSAVIFRDAVSSMGNRGHGKRGCYSVAANRQFDYDHSKDSAWYLDKAFVERRLEVLREAYERYKELAAVYGGPAVQEVFGEQPFAPVQKKEAVHYDEKQQKLLVDYANRSGQITNRYIKGEERSFTIIAYPIPAIGSDYEQIFAETVRLNTLDYMLYRNMQQCLIQVLDQAERVHITGKGRNVTDLYVSIRRPEHPDTQTAFENCVADVNIPVGEVFTSPVLKGTSGVLHVTGVYLNELYYKDLKITFADGMITDYMCANFADDAENRRYIHENVLMQHDTLPMGEFAIGTNTTAYRMARDFKIADKLPILIAEKTGPHFAVGDTCYSHAEETKVYNPDGKEIIAKDNERSVLRKEDVSKAYFNCHTDITIPYDELDAITAHLKDGSTTDIIRDGKFVVPGTEELNVPLEQ
uniref:Leucyl aminopeptidase n=1 Tax=Eubacterium plexicaudatum ASF492 TaxID=1235802 RepID=N2A621_9FIRM